MKKTECSALSMFYTVREGGGGEGEGEGRRKGASFGEENLYFELKTWGIMQGKIKNK